MDRDAEAAGVLDGAQVEDLGAVGGHLEGLLAGDGLDAAGGGDDARVRGEQAVNVGVDLADVGVEGGGQRDGGGVGAAASQGGDVLDLVDALESGDDGDGAHLDGAGDALGQDADDAGAAVLGVGEDAGLGTIDRYSKASDTVQALVSGKVDCVIIDNEPAKAFVSEIDGLKILDTEYITEDYAAAMNKENTALYDAVNTAMQELLDDGTIQSIIDKYITAD